MTPFQWVFIPLLAILFVLEALRTLRTRGERRLVGWMRCGVWLAGIGLVASPSLATLIAREFGIGRGADFVFYLSVLAGAVAIASMYRRLERLERELAEVVRQLALQGVRRPSAGPGAGGSAERKPETS